MLVGTARNRPSTSNCHTIVSIECWWVQPETGPQLPTVLHCFNECWWVQPEKGLPLPTVTPLFQLNVGGYSPKQAHHFQLSYIVLIECWWVQLETGLPLPTVTPLFQFNVGGYSPKQARHFDAISHHLQE